MRFFKKARSQAAPVLSDLAARMDKTICREHEDSLPQFPTLKKGDSAIGHAVSAFCGTTCNAPIPPAYISKFHRFP